MSALDTIIKKIKSTKTDRISFYDFMKISLYDSKNGYYNQKKNIFGKLGDFLTNQSVGEFWAEIWSEIFFNDWEDFGRPDEIRLIEQGAGNGIFFSEIIFFIRKKFPEFYEKINFVIIEPFDSQKKQQKKKILKKNNILEKVIWINDLNDLNDLDKSSDYHNIYFCNELIDAFPVHRYKKNYEKWQETYISRKKESDRDELIFLYDKISDHKNDYFSNDLFSNIPTQFVKQKYCEINFDMLEWISDLVKNLKKSKVYIIDYGYFSENNGHGDTIRAYLDQKMEDINLLLQKPGELDITSSVNFNLLINHLKEQKYKNNVKLKNLEIMEQGRFIIKNSHNLLSKISASDNLNFVNNKNKKKIMALKTLTHPAFFGSTFFTISFDLS